MPKPGIYDLPPQSCMPHPSTLVLCRAGGKEDEGQHKGSKGYPKGITDHRTGKLQAHISFKDQDGKTVQRFIPGLYDTRRGCSRCVICGRA